MATDTEVILMSLQKERDELHERIMQVDRIFKRVKSLEYADESEIKEPKQLDSKEPKSYTNLFPQTANIKIQILRVFDMIGVACRLKEIQTAYNDISGNEYNIREPLRTLNKAKLVKLIREKSNNRGFLWAKTEWIEDDNLLDKYKPEGFDMLYRPDSLLIQ